MNVKYWIFDKIEKQVLGYGKYKSGQLAMEKLVNDFEFDTILDLGCGDGYASDFFTKHGKKVTANDYGRSINFQDTMAEKVVIGDFNQIDFGEQFDAIWCAHCMEHQLNVQSFLERINSLLREGGVLAITVPPMKNTIVGGHVSVWNAGLVLYRLILAGFDCHDACVLRYGYNISVIVRKTSINVLDKIVYDKGDIRTLAPYWPKGLKMRHKEFDDSFYGWIKKLNW
jgi:SAM-dependent methyltransferase